MARGIVCVRRPLILGDRLALDIGESTLRARVTDGGDREEVNTRGKPVDYGARIDLTHRAHVLQVPGRGADVDPEGRQSDWGAVAIRCGWSPGKHRCTRAAGKRVVVSISTATTTAAARAQAGAQKNEGKEKAKAVALPFNRAAYARVQQSIRQSPEPGTPAGTSRLHGPMNSS